MNKQESKDFNFVHQYNMDGIQAIIQLIIKKWNEAGKPQTKEEFTPEFKHFYIWIAGLIERLWNIVIRGNIGDI